MQGLNISAEPLLYREPRLAPVFFGIMSNNTHILVLPLHTNRTAALGASLIQTDKGRSL